MTDKNLVKCEVIGGRVRAGKQEVFKVGDEVELSPKDAKRLDEMKVISVVGKKAKR